MKRWILPAIFALMALSSASARADSTTTPPPGWTGSYQVTSADNRYILVMLGTYPRGTTSESSEETQRQNALADRYRESGMYRNDCTATPLWTMPYISWRNQLTVAADGRHIIDWGSWTWWSGSYGETALTFYEDGLPIKSYKVRDLVAFPAHLPHTVSHYRWLASYTLDDARGRLSVATLNGDNYIFDIATGKIVSAVIPTTVATDQTLHAASSGGASDVSSAKMAPVKVISTALPKSILPKQEMGSSTQLASLATVGVSLSSVLWLVWMLTAVRKRAASPRMRR